MKRTIGVMLLYVALIVSGCSDETTNEENLLTQAELTNLLHGYKEFKLLENFELSKDQIESFQKQGFGGNFVRVFEVEDIRTGETQNLFEIGRDGYIYENELATLGELNKNSSSGSTAEDSETFSQYRTANLVSVNGVRIIEIKAINFFYFQNMSNVAEGLTRAVNNYNNLNLGVRFVLNFYTIKTLAESWPLYTPGINVVIHNGTGSNEPGGSALFPSGGNPGREIRINSSTNNESFDINEHVATHEIGHCIGMRHTDFFNRHISCSEGGNEGSAGIGAIHIPGTPAMTNIDMDSVFLSCFSESTDGEFSLMDIVALNTIY